MIKAHKRSNAPHDFHRRWFPREFQASRIPSLFTFVQQGNLLLWLNQKTNSKSRSVRSRIPKSIRDWNNTSPHVAGLPDKPVLSRSTVSILVLKRYNQKSLLNWCDAKYRSWLITNSMQISRDMQYRATPISMAECWYKRRSAAQMSFRMRTSTKASWSNKSVVWWLFSGRERPLDQQDTV